jgi:hypothetical protein
MVVLTRPADSPVTKQLIQAEDAGQNRLEIDCDVSSGLPQFGQVVT